MADTQGCDVELGSDKSGPVDRLSASFRGLEIGNNSHNQKTNQIQGNETPGSLARPQVCSRQAERKENSASMDVTPSRLACFKQLQEELTCAVCLDICVRPCTTPCGHNYCRSCLRRNTELNRPCPKCRANLPAGFTLNINTTLWNTIQHLFPAAANAKPLTPPPVQAPQQTYPAQIAGRRAAWPGSSANGHPAAAPFRRPRFVPAWRDVDRPGFTGHPSSRANANTLATHGAGMGNIGLASLSGRSVSGPRPQRPTSSSSVSGPAATGDAMQPSVPPPVLFSLAELGVHPAREGAAARRERRRSRSAERWEVTDSSLLGSAYGGTAELAGSTASVFVQANPQPSSSQLLQLLSGAIRNTADAATSGPHPHIPLRSSRPHFGQSTGPAANAIAGSGLSISDVGLHMPAQQGAGSSRSLNNNPFLRLPRSAAATAVASTNASRGSSEVSAVGVVRSAGLLQVVAGRQDMGAGAAAGPFFNASQRALLSACISTQASALPRCALSRTGSSALGCSRADNTDAAAVPAPREASITSQDSGSCTTAGGEGSSPSTLGSNWSAKVFDDVSELELLPENEELCGAGSCVTASDSSVALLVTAGGRGRNTLADRGCRNDRGGAPPEDLQPRPSLRLERDINRDNLVESAPADSAIGDVMTPLGGTDGPIVAVAPVTRAQDTPSASWSELDAQMARAMEPFHISPPNLPRLRVPVRREAIPLPAPANHHMAASDAGSTPPGGLVIRTRACSPSQHNTDPDLASNYDGEDPSGADTFFSSPFFDRALLMESLQEAAGSEAGSDVGFSSRWLAGGAGDDDWLNEDSGSPFGGDILLSADAGAAGELAGGDRVDAAAVALSAPAEAGGLQKFVARSTGASRPVQEGLRSSITTDHGSAPQAQATLAANRAGLLPGDRGCPIELLSDSEEEEPGAYPIPVTDASAALCGAGGLRGEPADPVRRTSQRVVSGLRRPRRT